ncbi:MAG TPA: hypothetical protein VM925_22485 [Labilithrix sp.]|nr:hypothetical protein [Labilithrix sp.]
MSGQSQMEGLAQESEVEADGTPIRQRMGFIVGGGVAAAVVSSLPASLRASGEGSVGLALEQWLVLSAVSTPLAVATVAVLRRARVGLRLLMGERASLLALGVLWWSVIQLGLLSVFGALLRKTTHHHALAGVTFAMFAVMSGILVALFARRATTMLARGGPGAEQIGLRIAAGCACVGIVVVGLRTSRAEGLQTTAAIVDALVLVSTSLIASSRWILRWKQISIVGIPLAVVLIVIGLTTLGFDPAVQKRLTETSPMFSFVTGLFGS